MRTTSALLALLLTLLCFEVSAAHARKRSPGGARKSAAPKGSNQKPRRVASAQTKGKKGRTYVSRSSRPARQSSPTFERYSEIQKALAAKGFYNGSTDGRWDSESTEALKRFQAANDLKPDGRIGALTLIALGLGPRHEISSGLE